MYGPLLEALQSGATVVTANNRLARNLAVAYGQARQRSGQQAWQSPAVLSWNAWLLRLWEQSELEGGRARLLRRISDTDSTVLWEEIARTERDGFGGPAASTLAAQAWKQLCDWQAVAAPEWSQAGLSPDQQVFLRWAGQYRDRLSAEGWTDTALLAEELLVDIDNGVCDQHETLLFAGFDVWSPGKLALREALAGRGVDVSVVAELAGNEVQASRTAALNDRAELEQAACWARAQIETNPGLEVCVIVRDLNARAAEARRVFMDVFCPDWRARPGHMLPVNFSYGDALRAQPRVAAALNLLALAAGDNDYRRFSLALRTPFIGGGRDEANQRAQLDLRYRDKLGSAFTLNDADIFARGRAPGFADLLSRLAAHVPRRERRSLIEWAEWISTVLEAAGWPGDDTLDSVAYQELEAWHQLLREYAASSKVRGPATVLQALGLLERLAAARLHQPEAGAGVVQVMGILEAAGHEFDRLWVTGMTAEDWPSASNPNPLLPFDLQRRLGMPGSSPDVELAYAGTVTQRLRQSSPVVIFSWSGMRDGEALHPSGLIADLPQTVIADLPSSSSWADSMLCTAPVEALTDDRPLPLAEGARASGGAALFRLQASCPLRAFLELRLGAREVSDPVTGIGYRERGTLAHKVLEDFYAKFPDSAAIRALDQSTAADELNEMTEKHMRALPGLGRSFMRTVADLETQRLLPLLVEFVMLDMRRGDFTVIGREESNSDVRVGPLTIWLKMDRLDQLANGELVVIDYKTGKVARKNWNPARPGDMQLPLYATFMDAGVSGVAFAQLSAHGVRYEGLAAESVEIEGLIAPAKLRGGFRDADGEKIADWESLTEAWRACVLALAQDFADGDCSINPRQAAAAEGQLAVLTRVHELPGVAFGEEGGDG